MQFTFSNNPIDRLSCWLHNKKEDLSRVQWLKGKRKEVECRICGKVLDSSKDPYSPMQCGWHKVDKYNNWICHNCFDHRDFRPFIEMIDEENRKEWEERHRIITEQIEPKAQEIIDLLKEYLPEYKETLDLYKPVDLFYFDDDGYFTENNFSFIIDDKNDEYQLEIKSDCVIKSIEKGKKVIETEVAHYVDEEKIKTNPWTWDDAIKVIKKRLEEKK